LETGKARTLATGSRPWWEVQIESGLAWWSAVDPETGRLTEMSVPLEGDTQTPRSIPLVNYRPLQYSPAIHEETIAWLEKGGRRADQGVLYVRLPDDSRYRLAEKVAKVGFYQDVLVYEQWDERGRLSVKGADLKKRTTWTITRSPLDRGESPDLLEKWRMPGATGTHPESFLTLQRPYRENRKLAGLEVMIADPRKAVSEE